MESKQTNNFTVKWKDIYIIQRLLTLFEFNNQNAANYLFCHSTSVHPMYNVLDERKQKMIKKLFLLEIMIFRKSMEFKEYKTDHNH